MTAARSSTARSARPAEGGSSGVLSVAELQRALRLARQRSSSPTVLAELVRVDALDDSDLDLDLDADFLTDDLLTGALDDNLDTVGAGDLKRREARTPEPRRGPGPRFARRVLGLDREPKGSSGRGDADWLTEFDTPVAAAEPPARDKPVGVTSPDVRVSDASRGFAAVFWRWVARIAVAVLLLAGVNQVFVRPFRTSTPMTTAPGIDVAAAGQVAARFVADYLTHDPSQGDPSATVDTPVSSTGWSGTTGLSANLVQPGSAVRVDATQVLVSVAARIFTESMPAAMSTSAAPSASPTADRPDQRWVTLVVPVEATGGGGLRVSAGGPIFSGEPPVEVTPAVDGQPDSATTSATAGMASAFLAAYARSDVSYLASPGVTLTGLNNTVQLVSLNSWTVTIPTPQAGIQTAPAPTSGVGSATVIWQLIGTDLQIAQRYSIGLTSSQGRWYASAVSPNSSSQEG